MEKHTSTKVVYDHGPMGWILFTAWIGAIVYFFHQDQTFWGFILAVLKAIVWPAFVVYYGLQGLGV